MAKKKTDKPKTDRPKPNFSGVTSGTTAKLVRDERGDIKQIRGKNYGGISTESLREDAKRRASTGDSTYGPYTAPRVGGKQKPIAKSGNVQGGTKKMVKASKKRVNKSAASPAAKRAAKRLY